MPGQAHCRPAAAKPFPALPVLLLVLAFESVVILTARERIRDAVPIL